MYIRSESDLEFFAHVLFFRSFERRIRDDLNEAVLAGNYISTHLTDNGFDISIFAYSDVAMKIYDTIIQMYLSPKISYEFFDYVKNHEFNYISSYNLKQRGIMLFRRLIKYSRAYFVRDISYVDPQLSKTIHIIPFHSYITMMFYGDIKEENLTQRIKFLNETTENPEIKPIKYTLEGIEYKTAKNFLLALYKNKEMNRSVVVRFENNDAEQIRSLVMNYYPLYDYEDGNTKAKIKILFELLKKHLQKAFDVEFNVMNSDGVHYLYLGEESEKKSPIVMNKELDMKIKTFSNTLDSISLREIDNIKAKVSFRAKMGLYTLQSKAKKVWKEIYFMTYNFTPTSSASFIVKMGKNDIIEMYNTLFVKEKNVKKLSIQLFSYGNEIKDEQKEAYTVNKNITSVVTRNIQFFHQKNE